MGGSVKVSLTHQEGSFLMRYCEAQLPEKLGDEPFDLSAQSTCKDQLGSLRATLRKVSPLTNPPSARSAAFGSPEAWDPAKPEIVKCEHCKHDFTKKVDGLTLKKDFELQKVEVEFKEDDVYGVWWALFLAANPKFQKPASNGEYEELVIPLAERFGWLEDLRERLKISVRKEFLPKKSKVLESVTGNGSKVPEKEAVKA